MCGLWVDWPGFADRSLAAEREDERETRSSSSNIAAERDADRATRSSRLMLG